MATRPAASRAPARQVAPGPGLPTPYAENVLDLVARIPPGRVMAYGDIAAVLQQGGGPRQVGTVMSRWGDGVPWHRVVRADGRPAQCHAGQALRLLRGEGAPLSRDGSRVDMARARWSPASDGGGVGGP